MTQAPIAVVRTSPRWVLSIALAAAPGVVIAIIVIVAKAIMDVDAIAVEVFLSLPFCK